MAWVPQTNRTHFLYGAGAWSVYYWDPNYNPGASVDLCMPNCTTFAYGRPLENGWPRPVTQFRNANNWHNYVNTADGWVLLNYTSGMQLLAGDIVEWQAQHVAVVEENGTNPNIGASWYSVPRGGNTMQEVCDYWNANASRQHRFWHYHLLTTENSQAGGHEYPRYVLRYQGIQPDPPVPPTADLLEIILSGKITKDKKGTEINVKLYKQ